MAERTSSFKNGKSLIVLTELTASWFVSKSSIQPSYTMKLSDQQ